MTTQQASLRKRYQRELMGLCKNALELLEIHPVVYIRVQQISGDIHVILSPEKQSFRQLLTGLTADQSRKIFHTSVYLPPRHLIAFLQTEPTVNFSNFMESFLRNPVYPVLGAHKIWVYTKYSIVRKLATIRIECANL